MKRRNSRINGTESREEPAVKRARNKATKVKAPPNTEAFARGCEKLTCVGITPSCFAQISDKCANITGNCFRWHHISTGEHFCQNCQFVFSKREKGTTSVGSSAAESLICELFHKWKGFWTQHCRAEPQLRLFFAQEVLSWWLQCSNEHCRKWREVASNMIPQLTPAILRNFKCGMYATNDEGKNVQKVSCTVDQDPRVDSVLENRWIESLALPALMKCSPAYNFLEDGYFYDGVGMAPSFDEDITKGRLSTSPVTAPLVDPEVAEVMRPFYQPQENGRALCIRPDVMEYDELLEFPEYSREQTMYLGLRNLVISLWNMNPKEWLTPQFCADNVICRGMVRIRSVYEVERILKWLTRKGVVNIGLLKDPPFEIFSSDLSEEMLPQEIIVIGAGISGLAAARQLKNFGMNVRILEARNRLGGRICDDHHLGVPVGLGPQLVTGVVNNPVALMCLQASIPLHKVKEDCRLLEETGEFADTTADKRVDFHFNCLLDALYEWRAHAATKEDISLELKLAQFHKAFLHESHMKFSSDEERLLGFHRSNLEFSCGAKLHDVSALHWDHNEAFAQFSGEHALMIAGYSEIVKRFDDLSVELGVCVKKINYSGAKVVVTTAKGEYTCDKVLVTVPLTVLKRGDIEYEPPLPSEKIHAIAKLGAGIIEKVAVRFPRKFWQDKIKDADYFGHVASVKEQRGYFAVFYDFTTRDPNALNPSYVLMAYLSGDAVKLVNEKSDEELVEIFVNTLRKMFPEEDVPDPIDFVVTHWAQDPLAAMSYSFVGLGATGESYDVLAKELENKVFFAGEHTNRHFPQTVTGAYLTGLREAGKIVSPRDLLDL